MVDESSATAGEKPIEAIKKETTTHGTISVDTEKVRSDQQETGSLDQERGFVQAHTPKHANKKEELKGSDQQKITPDRGEPKADDSRLPAYAGQRPGYNGNFPPSRPHEGHPLGGSGAFQPHERRQLPLPGQEQRYYNRGPPMQVSPGGSGANGDYHRRRYHNYPPNRGLSSRMEGGYPPHPSHAPPHHGAFYADQRGYSEYGGRPPPPASYEGPRGQYGYHSGHAPNYLPQAYSRYPEGRGSTQSWATHPPNYPPQSVGAYPKDRPAAYYHTEHHSSDGAFSRSVSTSFDRSVKSREPHHDHPKMKPPTPIQGDIKSVASDDMSWKQLKQVHSVDDIGSKPAEAERQINSTSSSLTNSPTDGTQKLRAEKHAQAMVEAVEQAVTQPSSSLDSLASVSSAQRPIETVRADAPPSPASIGGSLDLMKCSSGSSGLLHLPPQQRGLEAGLLMDTKRARDEERGDMTAAIRAEEAEIRRAPSGEAPAPKRVKLDEASKEEPSIDAKKKSSPLSITCSPSAPKQIRPDPKMRPKMDYHASPHTMDGYYDKPPQFSYSIDSAPSIPRDGPLNRKPGAYSSIPPRPGSAASGSTISGGPMHLDARDPANAMVPSISSWEIHAQDSFGNGSVGGGQGLASSFSFQEFPALSASESNLGGIVEHGPPGTHGHPGSMHAAMESRNQSFEGGHYHGGGSFDHYGGGRHGPYQQEGYKHGHTGSFPPHAPSWGTAASGGSQYHHPGGPQNLYGPYGGRNYPPHAGMMRNYSQDGGHRASPPPGLPHQGSMSRPQGPPSGFQPPPEFAAPHNPHLARRPPPSVYIMTSSQNGGANPGAKRGSGVFSWSKEDDARLTEIMKKYKNPRDWEPIAKEHGGGKTSKECHERWIRYLKPGVRKGQWTDHEDAIVIEAVTTSSEQPFTRWSDLAQRLPGRVGKQIRDRWVNHLNPNINHLPFSKEDDLLLWEGHKKLGKRWVEISTKYFHSSRSENHIKNRWYSASFKKFISNEFGPEAYASAKGAGKNKDKKSKKLDADEATIKAR